MITLYQEYYRILLSNNTQHQNQLFPLWTSKLSYMQGNLRHESD